MRMLVKPTLNISSTLRLPVSSKLAEPLRATTEEAQHVFHAYARTFAGKTRATRDVALLQEMAERLREIQSSLLSRKIDRAAAERVAVGITSHLALFAVEIRQIQIAFKSGSVKERSAWLAERLNEQLIVYQTHFAARPRLSRRPGLLRRCIVSLSGILSALEDLGPMSSGDDRLTLCRKRAQSQWSVLHEELREIERIQMTTPLIERVRSLKAETRLIHADFKRVFEGKPRASVERRELGYLCDRLGEIEHQMIVMFKVHEDAETSQGLAQAQELLNAYEAEYQRVAEARRQRSGNV